MKTCSKCGLEKDESQFYLRTRGGPLKGTCKECRLSVRRAEPANHPARERDRKYYADKKKKDPHFQLKKYGLTTEQWDERMLNQGGMCAICDSESKLNVDHDHATGKVRALLCSKCNFAIGLLKDSPELIQKAAEYVKRFS